MANGIIRYRGRTRTTGRSSTAGTYQRLIHLAQVQGTLDSLATLLVSFSAISHWDRRAVQPLRDGFDSSVEC